MHSTTRQATPRGARLAPLLAGLALLGLHLSTLTSGNTFDAVIFAQTLEHAVAGDGVVPDFFNPAHVLHLPFAALVMSLAHACGIEVGGLIVLQVLAAVAGAALGALLAARLAPEAGLPLALTTALAASLAAGTWFFATEGETNHLALAFAVASLGPVLALLRGAASRAAVVGAGALLAAAAAFHLTLGTLWIAILALAVLRHRDRLKPVVAALALASGLLLIAYVPRVVMLEREVPGWKAKHVVSFAWDAPGADYLLSEGFEPVREWLALTTSLGRGGGALEALAAILAWAWLLAGLAAVVRGRGGALLRLSGIWLAATLALYAAWGSLDFEFACFMTTPLAIFGCCGVAALLPSARARLGAAVVQAILAALVAAGAWRGTIAPKLDPAANPYRRLADQVAAATTPQDCILVSELAGNPTKVYVSYFGLRSVIIPDFSFGRIPSEESLRRVRRQIDACCGRSGSVYALGPLVDDVPGESVAWDAAALRAALRAMRPEPVLHDGERVVLYRLGCP